MQIIVVGTSTTLGKKFKESVQPNSQESAVLVLMEIAVQKGVISKILRNRMSFLIGIEFDIYVD
jgi:hypothetical protein